MQLDWQTVVTGLIGLAAVLHLGRRWLAPLWRRHPPADPACGQPGTAGSPGCSAGCGSCGSSATPQRDHRVIQVIRRTPEAKPSDAPAVDRPADRPH